MAPMTDHEYFRLRVISISARSALTKLGDSDASVIRMRADTLLAEFERDVRSNGADPELLRRIAELGSIFARHPRRPRPRLSTVSSVQRRAGRATQYRHRPGRILSTRPIARRPRHYADVPAKPAARSSPRHRRQAATGNAASTARRAIRLAAEHSSASSLDRQARIGKRSREAGT